MRTIKFRAWDGKKYLTKDDFTLLVVDTGDIYAGYRRLEDGCTDNDIILEQFTGLLDKNGKEIYEGDILQRGECKKIVVFDDKTASFKMYNEFDLKHKGDWDILQSIRQDWINEMGTTIIGNTHESEVK